MKTVETNNKKGKLVKSVLNHVLKTNANSTSCYIYGQPKAPKALDRFKKNDK